MNLQQRHDDRQPHGPARITLNLYGFGLEAMEQSGDWYYFLADGLGSTMANSLSRRDVNPAQGSDSAVRHLLRGI